MLLSPATKPRTSAPGGLLGSLHSVLPVLTPSSTDSSRGEGRSEYPRVAQKGLLEWPRVGRGARPRSRARAWKLEPLHPAFCPQFPDRTGVSQLHRVLHVPGPTEHLPPAEPDDRGRSPAHGPEHRALAPGHSRPLLPALPEGGKVGESGKTLLPETKPNLLSHVWLPIESAL